MQGGEKKKKGRHNFTWVICRRLPFPPSMLLLTHPPPSVHPRRNLAQPSGVRARAAPTAFHHLTRYHFWFRFCPRNEEKRGIWTELVLAQHQTWHKPLTLLPTDSPTATLRQGPEWVPRDSPPYIVPLFRPDVWIFMCAPRDLPLNPECQWWKQLRTKANEMRERWKEEWEGRLGRSLEGNRSAIF